MEIIRSVGLIQKIIRTSLKDKKMVSRTRNGVGRKVGNLKILEGTQSPIKPISFTFTYFKTWVLEILNCLNKWRFLVNT